MAKCKRCGKRLNKKLLNYGAVPLVYGFCSFMCANEFSLIEQGKITRQSD